MPEPWLGNLATARLLFIGSNPGISPPDKPSYYPTWSWSNEQIVEYFNARFEIAIRDGTRFRNQDGTFTRAPYWENIRRRAIELYGRDVRPGHDYALTEIVHCKSKDEKDGVREALPTCANLYLDRLLSLSGSRILVLVGAIVRNFFSRRYGLTHVPVNIAGRDRFDVVIAHPNDRNKSRDPKTFEDNGFVPMLPSLRAVLQGN